MSSNVEAVVCGTEEIKDGEMKEVVVGDGKALLVKEKGELYAIGHKCTHYGAPLVKGVLGDGRVRCPWHGACFNYKTGDIEDFPGLDSVQKFEVKIKEGKVHVSANKDCLSNFRRVKTMCCPDPENKETYLIVGGGPASVAAAETLRQQGFSGRVVIATKEMHLPYDRPKLSKALDCKPEGIALRNIEFYKEHCIDILHGKEAVSVNTQGNCVMFSDGTSQSYNKLLLATGAVPRSIPVPGVDQKNVCTLRSPEDACFILEQAKDKHVVIIGGSFIGMEVAAYLASKAASVSVVDMVSVPFQLALGDKVGAVLGKMISEKGIKFYGNSGVKEISGSGGVADGVVIKDGTKLQADVIVLGTGVAAATGFLKGSDIEMNKFGQVIVNKNMKTNIDNVYAAGDIVEFPLFTVNDQRVNIGHWQIAHAHGRTAAFNMVNKCCDFKSVPFFWTQMFGKSLRYTGYGPGYDDVIIHGDLEAPKFVAYYTKGDIVVAAASMFYDPIVSEVAEVMSTGRTISKQQISSDPRGWATSS